MHVAFGNGDRFYSPTSLLVQTSIVRDHARYRTRPDKRQRLGQYFTPVWVAEFMASMFGRNHDGRPVRVLDPGAGAGTLFAAYVAHCLMQDRLPRSLSVTAFEIDSALRPFLEQTAEAVRCACEAVDLDCEVMLRCEDFTTWAADEQAGSMFSEQETFDAAILNPPYKKLASSSTLRRRLDVLGISAPNLYAAFLGLAIHVVKPGGSIVAIVPRSFCNGTYFKNFRRYLLDSVDIRRIHSFGRRDAAFGQDSVLQENVVLALRRSIKKTNIVSLSFNDGGENDPVWIRKTSASDVVHSDDPNLVVRLPRDSWSLRIADSVATLPCSLPHLGIEVSTGPVVGFRHRRSFASPNASRDVVPLLHPANFRNMHVRWPVDAGKPQGLMFSNKTERVLVPRGWYVVTRRFTTKEEPRRIVASVIDPGFSDATHIGIENHLNYFHRFGRSLDRAQALGLATFLNSSWMDNYFRQLSGHTQVNASDLRNLKYPYKESLMHLGEVLDDPLVDQEADAALRTYCKEMHDMPESNVVQHRIGEALSVLRELGLPKAQQNERSALALLALLRLRPGDPWTAVSDPLIGVTPIMKWAATHYDRSYAPNTRETFRRFTLHQFVDAGLVVPNPDQPHRPVNSPKYCYQLTPEALSLIKTYGTSEWRFLLRQDAGCRRLRSGTGLADSR